MRPGEAAIKQEYLVMLDEQPKQKEPPAQKESEVPEENHGKENESESASTEPPPPKKQKTKGQNKARPRTVPKVASEFRICPNVHRGTVCQYGDKCKFMHDVREYMEKKPKDIGEECINFQLTGKCKYGVECRYAKSHLTENYENIVVEEKYKEYLENYSEKDQNVLTRDLMNILRKKKFKYEKTSQYLKKMALVDSRPSRGEDGQQNTKNEMPGVPENVLNNNENTTVSKSQNHIPEKVTSQPEEATPSPATTVGCVTDEDVIKLRQCEKKKVDFKDKLYLAPLTTVGNLPYRRVCKRLGVDITCGEMAMSTNLLQGGQGEWALLRRHPSEDVFGVQICGGYPDSMSKVAELINAECNVDFIDINMGCPIDLVFKKGEGSALMGRLSKLEKVVRGMVEVSDIPITIKMRTGIYENKNTAHKVVPMIKEWGVGAMALHGRTREQRYTKAADWEYINQCAQLSDPIPFFGNGDILSFEDANLHRENTHVSGLMIARGALIKPWIFTEIKEQRHWDISSHERFEILREYTNFGLEHWGSDHKGVENTRRFLLEWLSFLHRYIPVGVLEQPPQKINQRPPAYVGRDDMETMLASRNANDWVKLSEMLLGPVPDNFIFLPKHKANSYS
ncbi:tRNA-dihydrouridine(47) synthase [NAD(P)(+)]-like [Clytia hemisphaerica]|uniref:tRNA-dihydrouridine(47) synthase [NAD(P)(+)] n=1 Tax=Clytia hemisphaerica TaxID=252671 RepID=A0A7M5V4U9_9CNID|eukprot:TCONS_00011794-protein